MLKNLQRFFEQKIYSGNADSETPERSLQLATASLLIEVSRADFQVDASERQAIIQAVQSFFSLTQAETEEIVALAESEMQNATCLFEFTRLVNDHFDYVQRLKIIELMWRVSYADLDKDKYEEHLIRKISDLLYVSHSDFIRLRNQVQP